MTDHASEILLPDCSKLAVNWKNDNDATICRYDVIVFFKKNCHISLDKFSYWFKFHVNIITGFGVKKIFVYKRSEIRKSEILPSEFFQYLETRRSWGNQIWQPKSLMKSYLILLRATITALTFSELLTGNQHERGKNNFPLLSNSDRNT